MLKKFIQTALLLVVLFTTVKSYAQVSQAPDGIQFQALATDANGHPAAGRVIYVKDAIVAKTATGTILYAETFKVTASSAGIFSILLGKGTYASGVSSIANIDWANGPFFLNLKVAVEPTIPTASWNVNNEYVDLGTSQFWSVPYALYAGSVKGADTKLNIADTAAMLKPYFTAVNLKANIESPTFTGTVKGITKAMVGLANVDNTSDIDKPVSTVTKTALDLKANTSDINAALALKANAADVTTALDLKVDKVTGKALSTNDYTTAEKTKLAAITGTNTGDQDLSALAVAADVNTALALKANTADVNTALALKASTASLSTVATSGNYNDLSNKPTIPSAYTLPTASASVLGGVKVGANLSIDANGVLSATVSNNASSITGTLPVANGGTGTTTIAGIKSLLGFSSSKVAIGDQAGQTSQADGGVGVGGGAGANNQGGSAVAIGYVAGYNNQGASSIAIGPNAAQGGQGAQAVAVGFAAGQNGQGANAVAIGTFAGQSGQAANSIAINASGTSTPLNPANAGFYVDPIRNASSSNSLFYNSTTKEITYGTAPPTGAINLASGVTGTLPIANGGTGATTAAAALTNLGAAPIASPTFTGTVTTDIINTGALSATSVTAPTYASAPKALSYTGSTINWNPAQGLNAAVTLTQNSTLSFTTAPPVGSYGTVVLTQDATGNRTITLPTINGVANKVLGSASTSTVALSTAANAKDILNFYFDGSSCYWNIGQGYGSAASSASTNLATSVSGTLAVANGGTGATTLIGLIKGSGTNAFTAAVAGTDYQAPITLTTTGSGAATLSGTTLNIPTVSSTVSAGSISGTVAVANGGTGATTAAAGLTNLGAAPIASPTFTGTVTTGAINAGVITATSVTAPIYASTPQALTAGSAISWNPALGLNASVTLNQNSTLNFTSTPTAGAYGTLVITQGTGGNFTITLPSTSNKVLGSTSTTAIALSTAAGAKDILNFYYDGTNCFWNIGQGYGSAAASTATNFATGVTGTLTVANGGTGATSLTGYIKGTGTSSMTASTTIPVADITGTLPVANGGTGTTNGSITGTSSITITAGGSNQNVSILPSGTGSVGIGTNSPNSLAVLDVSSTTKGFLPPRMTYAQKISIASPPQGLMIYCTNCGTNGEPEYYNGTAWVNMAGGTAASVPITLGSTYGGGKVFYILQSGDPGYVSGETHGLIAATSDVQGYRVFGCRGWPAGTSAVLGTGAANTTTLLGCSETNFAAKLARAVRDGGYSDWYLPSKDELNKLYLNKNLVGNFLDVNYWSSTEGRGWVGGTYYGDLSAEAFYQNFNDGTQSWDDKNAQKGIRAIRSF